MVFLWSDLIDRVLPGFRGAVPSFSQFRADSDVPLMSLGSTVLLSWQVRGIGSEYNLIKTSQNWDSMKVLFLDFNCYHVRFEFFLKLRKCISADIPKLLASKIGEFGRSETSSSSGLETDWLMDESTDELRIVPVEDRLQIWSRSESRERNSASLFAFWARDEISVWGMDSRGLFLKRTVIKFHDGLESTKIDG